MRKLPSKLIPALLALFALNAAAATRYVNLNSPNPTPPFISWATAATNIQDAIDAAGVGDLVLVTNGVYRTGARPDSSQLSNRVVATLPLTIQSVNGPAVTVVHGGRSPFLAGVRCFSLANGCVLNGFTVTNGATLASGDNDRDQSGGGIWCASTGVVISNCVIVGNECWAEGGGVVRGTLYNCNVSLNTSHFAGGGTAGGILNNCSLVGNSTTLGGGGASACTLNSCLIQENYAYVGFPASSGGGGVTDSILNDCLIVSNWASDGGGAIASTLNRCVVSSNSATLGGGGVYGGTLTNCILRGNGATQGGGAKGSTLQNCALTGNQAVGSGGGSFESTLFNCISYYNSAGTGDNFAEGSDELHYCCATPLPGGAGNFTNPPVFVDLATGNLRLQPASPCLNAGNNSFNTSTTDLDGNPRVVTGTVDVGAYEFQSLVRYVNVTNTTPASPFTSWITAATNIQDAIDVAADGDLVLVTNGIYSTGGRVVYGSVTNRIAITKPIAVHSVNGPAFTTIVGSGGGWVRCAYLTNGASLSGFTLTNGAVGNGGDAIQENCGGGIWGEGTNAFLSGCVVTGNSANYLGGGVYSCTISNCDLLGNFAAYNGGGVHGATLYRSMLANNFAGWGGGADGSTLYGCILTNNSGGSGGGASYSSLSNCLVIANHTSSRGGGAFESTLQACKLINNTTSESGGGAHRCTLLNCLVVGNAAGNGGGAKDCTLRNCTIVNNACADPNGAGGAANCSLNNSIILSNTAAIYPNYDFFSYHGLTFNVNFCCTTPLPPDGVGNIESFTSFVDSAAGDFRLPLDSPCVNAGNNAYVDGAADIANNPRIAGGTVDLGAYEFQMPASVLSYAWAQKYGLPTDGSADFSDTDGDGADNFHECCADTIPTNALSYLQIISVITAPLEATVTWQSVATRNYWLERATNLSSASVFEAIVTDIKGVAGTMTYTDISAADSGSHFYRVGVRYQTPPPIPRP